MIKTKDLIDKFEQASLNDRGAYADNALFVLLREFQEYLPKEVDGMGEFHKLFRQTDVTPYPGVDMAIWNLLHATNLIWELAAAKDYVGSEDE